MKEELETSSRETLRREKLAFQYGSYENYCEKRLLVSDYIKETEAYKSIAEKMRHRATDATEFTGEVLAEELDERIPYWMDPFVLRELPLASLGSPELSEEWSRDTNKDEPSARALKPGGVFYRDYSRGGWPKSEGRAVRMVTEREDKEIQRRLKRSGLTKVGAEVPTEGWTLAQMIEEDRPQPGWIVKDVLRCGGAAMVYGPSGIGKTWLTHTLMILAAAGHEVGVRNEMTGQWTLQAGGHAGAKVCLLDGEMIGPDISARAKVLCEALRLRMVGTMQGTKPMDFTQLRLSMLAKGDKPDEVEDTVQRLEHIDSEKRERLPQPEEEGGPFVDLSRIVIYPKAEQDHRADFVDLADPEWKHRIVEFCKGQGVQMLILDNLATLSESLEDENSAANWNPLNSLIVALKKEGVATILVHHSNKGNHGYRGSSSLATTLETIVKLEPLGGAEAADGAGFKIKFEKNRAHGQPGADGKSLRLKDGRWVAGVDPHEMAEAVVEMAKSLRYQSQAEIGAKLGVDQATVSRAIKAAEARKRVDDGEVLRWLKEARRLAKDLAAPMEPEVIEEYGDPDYDL
jgi:hypothetical protein